MLIDNDCVLALEPSQFFITHPCFMVFPSKTVNEIDFLAGVYDLKADTEDSWVYSCMTSR